MDSVMPTVNGLGPRDVPNDVDVPNGAEFRFVTLSVFSSRNGSGVCRPVGRAVAYNHRSIFLTVTILNKN